MLKEMVPATLFVLIKTCLIAFRVVDGFPKHPENAGHMTANAGQTVIFNCDVDFPEGKPVPYVVQWWKKGKDLPIYIWYDNYPTHADKDYVGRVSKVEPHTPTGESRYAYGSSKRKEYGLASLNITGVIERDRGWYNCRVLFLNRDPSTTKNATWYHLDVHAPPYFIQTPEEIVYVSLHDSIILSCQAGGTPTPEIVWFKGKGLISISERVGVFNDGTELRINNILERDLGEYTCVARNGVAGDTDKDRIRFTMRVVIAGAAVITKRPKNTTVLAGQGAELDCAGEANPGNVSIKWYKDGIPVESLADLDIRSSQRANGSLYFEKVQVGDEGLFICEVTNGIGKPITASAYLSVEYAARVSFSPDVQFIPRGLQGIITCHVLATPPVQFVTWSKNNRIYDPFSEKGVMAVENGSIIIDKVGPEHEGDYKCTPHNIHGSDGSSKVMHVKMKNPPEVTRRPDEQYHRSVGDKVSFPCGAIGNPTPSITWRRVDGQSLPRGRHTLYRGELTIDNLRKTDHGVYECVVHNQVATIVVRTELFIERTTPHAPTNLTVSNSETFAVTLEWLPGYSGCSSCKQTYKIRYREKDSKFNTWIELPVNPPDARKIQIHHLNPRTKYEFQVIGTNEFGDGMYSEIIETQTKADGGLDWSVYAPTASPSEQSTDENVDCKSRNRNRSSRSTANRKLLSSDCIEFNLEITGVAPSGPVEEDDPNHIPPEEAPGPARNLTLTQEAGGWVLRWLGPPDDSKVIYYTVQMKKDSQGEKWAPLTDSKIDPEEASYMIKNMGTAKAYLFRVFSYSTTSYSISEVLKYDLPENIKRRAVTAGLIGGILFFIVAIVLSVCTVKICNKRRRKKQEKAYNMVACRISEARNGGQICQVPIKRPGKRRVPVMRTFSSNTGLLRIYDQVTNCIQSLEDRLETLTSYGVYVDRDHGSVYGPDYGDGRRRSRVPSGKKTRYSLHVEYPTQPGHRGYISRSKEGKFVLEEDEDDDGGFKAFLPANRFRTRSVAIVAGSSRERLYSNMPPGSFVVESGMYKVGADREWERPEPIFWRQVVYGGPGSDVLGGLVRQDPRQASHRVGQLGEEDLKKLKLLDPSVTSLGSLTSQDFSQSRLIRTSNLELLRPETAAKLRASSPLDQRVPLTEWMSPLHNYSDLSSVTHRERSLPSTLLTSPSVVENTASSKSFRTGNSQRSSELDTIPEHKIPEDEEAPPGYSIGGNLSVVHADVHSRPTKGSDSKKRSKLEGPSLQRNTYQNAEAMFPNYALNYPAPIHQQPGGSISPSRQYPLVQVPPTTYWQTLYVQPDPRDFTQDPLATSSPPQMISPSYHFGQQATNMHDYENMPPVSHLYQQKPVRGRSDRRVRVIEPSDAEVTALTTSSSPGSSDRDEGIEQPRDQKHHREQGIGIASCLSNQHHSSSSGIASKSSSSSQHHTSSSSSAHSTSIGSQHLQNSLSDIKLEPILEAQNQPFYENWPPPKPPSDIRPRTAQLLDFMQPLTIVPPQQSSPSLHSNPVTPHKTLGQPGKPQKSRGIERRVEKNSGLSPHNTSLDTPNSRPGSAHSAPMLDVSIDRHYEFDTRTPTDDLVITTKGIQEALPAQWNRPYLGYNPRQRDRELGAAAQLARTERVFSDSEIYSPVFPRGKPPGPPMEDVSARVQAMKKEFQEYREQQQKQQQQQQDELQHSIRSPPSSMSQKSTSSKTTDDDAQDIGERLESLI